MDADDQPTPLGVALLVEPAVKGDEPGPDTPSGCFASAAARLLEQPKGDGGEDGRLGDPGGRRIAGPAPKIGLGEHLVGGAMGQDVGEEAVFVLAPEEGLQLEPGAGAVDRRPSQGDEASVPQPLVRIEACSGQGVVAAVVGLQDLPCRAQGGGLRAVTEGRSDRRRL